MPKVFRLASHEIERVVDAMGSCFASDRITVDGAPVGFMYREQPDDEIDSGWRFFAGDESEAYCEEPDHFAIYDVNTIANYDASIIPLLDSPVMCAFERNATGSWAPTSFPKAGLN